MSLHPVTVNIPTKLYTRIKRRAAQAHRSVEDEMLEAIAAIPFEERLPDELEEAVANLKFLDNDSLWRAARRRLPAEISEQLEQLHLKQQSVGLTETEMQTRDHLIQQYEKNMLVRAEAAVLLKQRNADISQLLHDQ
ncbi:MAG: hypothetical protein HUU38_12425 [Anaerolineales bacterium]|nr:hypothetical protein [Anaerolineales bacterium]